VILDELRLDRADWLRRTGWELKAEGACRGEVCVPLPESAVRADDVDVRAVAERLRMPLVSDDEQGPWALGPASLTGRALMSADLPELELPDLNGEPFRVSSLRGQKVVLTAWASW
jgi:hypothetical protein